MPDAERHAGDRGFDAKGSAQQKKTTGKQGRPAEDVNHKPLDEGGREEDQKNNQEIADDKKDLRTTRGPEDWGGYQGY